MKKLILTIVLAGMLFSAFSQKFYTRTGYVKFFSGTPVEDIEAITNQASCIIDSETGEVVAKVLMKSFEFEKALMQEHFNENYVESDKFPKAVFNATIENIKDIDLSKSDAQKVTLKGNLELHGVTKERTISGSITKSGENYVATAVFIIKPEDHDINIPKVVRGNIAEEIEVTVKFELSKLER